MRRLAPALLSLGLALAPLAPLAAQEASIAEPSQATPLQQRTAHHQLYHQYRTVVYCKPYCTCTSSLLYL